MSVGFDKFDGSLLRRRSSVIGVRFVLGLCYRGGGLSQFDLLDLLGLWYGTGAL